MQILFTLGFPILARYALVESGEGVAEQIIHITVSGGSTVMGERADCWRLPARIKRALSAGLTIVRPTAGAPAAMLSSHQAHLSSLETK